MAFGRVRALRFRKPLLEALVERDGSFFNPDFVPDFVLKFVPIVLTVPAFAATYLTVYFHPEA